MPSGISEDDLVAGFLGKAVRKEPEPEPEPEPPKMLIGTCIVCESPFTFESKRGKNPQMCSDQCRAENKRQKKKPKEKIVREHKCKTCDRQIVQTGRGGKRLFCGVCREERRKEAYKKYRQKNRVPVEREQGNCEMCGCNLGVKKGRGRVRKVCPTCYKERRRQQSRDFERKKYVPVVREYKCATCQKVFEQHGKGKLRKYCEGCS